MNEEQKYIQEEEYEVSRPTDSSEEGTSVIIDRDTLSISSALLRETHRKSDSSVVSH